MAAESDDRPSEKKAANDAKSLKGEKPTDRAGEEHIDIDVYDEAPSGPSVTVRKASSEPT